MPTNLLTKEQESAILKKVAEVTQKFDKPVGLWKFWRQFTQEQKIELDVRYLYNRFRALVKNRKNLKDFDLDTIVRMFFALTVPFDADLQMEALGAGCILNVDAKNQINEYENPSTGLKLTAFDEQGNLSAVRRNGRSINPNYKGPRAKKQKTTSSENPEDTSELLEMEDVEDDVIYEHTVYLNESTSSGTSEVPIKFDFSGLNEQNEEEVVETKPFSMLNYTSEFPTSSETSGAFQQEQKPLNGLLNVKNFLKKLKFMVLSLASPALMEVKKKIEKKLEKTAEKAENETILVSEISEFLGLSLKICQLSVSTNRMESLDWKRFLEIFEISLLSSNSDEFSELSEQVKRMIGEINGEMRIPTSSVQLAIENIMEMMQSQ